MLETCCTTVAMRERLGALRTALIGAHAEGSYEEEMRGDVARLKKVLTYRHTKTSVKGVEVYQHSRPGSGLAFQIAAIDAMPCVVRRGG